MMKSSMFGAIALSIVISLGNASHAMSARPCSLPTASTAKQEDLTSLRQLFDAAFRGDCCREPVDEHLGAICLLRDSTAARPKRPAAALTGDQAEWIWRWDTVVGKTGGATEFPNGFASTLLASIDRNVRRDPKWLATLFAIYRYADGLYAQEVAERLVDLLKSKPSVFTSQCSTVTQNQELIHRAVELYPEAKPALQKTYRARSGAAQCAALYEALG
jgi:hypothetical protein